jgi:Holliday junction resolvase
LERAGGRMTTYQKGYHYELKMATYFRRHGYFVTRSAGSHGVADLVAIKKGKRPLLIQCKTGEGGISLEERNKLYTIAIGISAIAIVASKRDRKPTIFVQLIGVAIKKGDGEKVIKGADF